MYYHTIYIGVNYKTPLEALRWISAIREKSKESLVVLVDNSKEYNRSLEDEIYSRFELVKYIDSGDNLGYFNGANYAFQYINDNYTFDWIAVSNVDVVLETDNVDKILDSYNDAGVVAPAILSIDSGFDKNPYRLRRQSKKNMIIKKLSFSNAIFSSIYSMISAMRNRLIKKKYANISKCQEGEEIYLPYGAAMFFSKAYFEKGCMLEYPLFIFGEELYVAEQCRRSELKILYVPSIRIVNYEHASTSKLVNQFVRRCNYESVSYILREFYS